jgi:ribosomal protein S17
MKKKAWHSAKQPVHHDNSECNTGNNIEDENIRKGTGDKRLCKECRELDKKGK